MFPTWSTQSGPNTGKTRVLDGKRGPPIAGKLAHFQAKHALGLDSGVDTGSPSENATTQREKSEARFYQNAIRSCAACAGLVARAVEGAASLMVACPRNQAYQFIKTIQRVTAW
jgi:phage FluMu protein Com